MKISNNLPQFKDSHALVIVTGWQTGRIYFANSGEIVLLEEVETDPREYSDKEGFFASRDSNMGGMHSGAPLEEDKSIIRKEFLDEFLSKVKTAVKSKKIKEIYIFSPSEGLHSLGESISKDVSDMVKSYYTGNYMKHKPFDLLEIINKEKPKPVTMMSEEAKKILEKGQ